MLIIFLFAIVIVAYTLPFAFLLNNDKNCNTYFYSKSLLYGIILVSFLSLLINFFLPLNIYISSFIPAIGFFLLIISRKFVLRLSFLKFLIIIAFTTTLFLAESNVYRPDAGLYHLPYIGILNSEKIIFGISNLHFRYSLTSIIQYFDAINNNLIFKNNGIVFGQILVALAVITNFFSILINYLKKREFNFHFFFLFFVMIYISYKMNRYSEYGNDSPAHFLVFFLISEILYHSKNIKIDNYVNNLILSLFIVQNKLTLILVILFNLINVNRINIKELLLNKKFIFLNFFFLIWITKNILSSGCMLYPLEFTCFESLSWTNKIDVVKASISAEAWTKGWSNFENLENLTQIQFIKNFNWLDAWTSVHLKHIANIILPYLIFCLVILSIFQFNQNKQEIKYSITEKMILLILVLCSIIWFIKSPLYRYGYSYLISLISLIFAFFCIKFKDLSILKINLIKFVLILCVGVLITKNILRIKNNNNDYKNYPWPKFYSMDNFNDLTDFQFSNYKHLNIITPIKGYCMYVKHVCSHYQINEGFNVKKKNGYLIFNIN